MILYIETNFLLSVASGQEVRAEEIFRIPVGDLTIAMPDICVMEALTATRNKINLSNKFEQEIDSRIKDIVRSVASSHAASLKTHLDQARVENRNIINDLQLRLNSVLEQATPSASGMPRILLLPLTPEALRESLDHDSLKGANDNLIFSVILSHARGVTEEKVLMTANTQDFGTDEIRKSLETVGITEFFARTDAFLGWFLSRYSSPEGPPAQA